MKVRENTSKCHISWNYNFGNLVKIRQIAGRSEVFNENVNKFSRFFFLLLKLNAP